MRIDFYHLQQKSLDKALPQLLGKAYSSGKRVVVFAGSLSRVEFLDNLLWTFEEESWLPHAYSKNGEPEDQPIWLTEEIENPNHAEIAVVIDSMPLPRDIGVSRILCVFDGRDEVAVADARAKWKEAKQLDWELHYWQQDDLGAWKEKNKES